MSWNYRVVKYKDGSGFGLHEVFYDKAGEPLTMTAKPISFTCDSDEDPSCIGMAMAMAQRDAFERDVLEEPQKWPGEVPLAGEPNEKFEQ